MVESYQRLKKWYLMPPCLTLSIIRYVSRVKWSIPEKGVAPSPTLRCCSNWKANIWVALDYLSPMLLTLWDFETQTYWPKSVRRPGLMLINKKTRTCNLVDSCEPHVEIKESEKIHNYLDLAREMKNLGNMKVTVMKLVVGALGIAPKGLERRLEIRSNIDTIETTSWSA